MYTNLPIKPFMPSVANLQHHLKSFCSESFCFKSDSFAHSKWHLDSTNSENTKCILIATLSESPKGSKNWSLTNFWQNMLSRYEKGCFLQPVVGGSVISCTFVSAGVYVTSQICKINFFNHSSIFNAVESMLHICNLGCYKANFQVKEAINSLD